MNFSMSVLKAISPLSKIYIPLYLIYYIGKLKKKTAEKETGEDQLLQAERGTLSTLCEFRKKKDVCKTSDVINVCVITT